jgi:hypothetical protein
MAYTRVGFTGDWPAFGVKSGGESYAYIDTKSIEDTGEKTELPDEDGDIVGAAYHGFKQNVQWSGAIKALGAPGSSTGVAAVGGQLTFDDVEGNTLVAYSDNVTVNESNSDWVKASGTATVYPSVATTTTTTTTTT